MPVVLGELPCFGHHVEEAVGGLAVDLKVVAPAEHVVVDAGDRRPPEVQVPPRTAARALAVRPGLGVTTRHGSSSAGPVTSARAPSDAGAEETSVISGTSRKPTFRWVTSHSARREVI